jgi:nicotinate phosphoribosyltransferase
MYKMNNIKNDLFGNDIILSALDDDAYKIHMQQVVHALYPTLKAEYAFKCRSDENLADLLPEIRDEINKLENVKFKQHEIEYLSKKRFLQESYLDALRNFKFHPSRQVFLSVDEDGQLDVRVRGTWFQGILYEVRILAIVSEVRNRNRFPNASKEQFRKVMFKKCEYLKSEVKKRGLENHFKFADMGTRRRLSAYSHEIAVQYMSQLFPDNFVGTSNYRLAMEYKLTAIGTMAHEYICGHQAIVNPLNSQKYALEAWDSVFRGDMGIALTDSISIDAFLRDFDLSLAKRFDGVRHDSADPYVWGEKIIAHYEKLGIDPKTKTLVFSDSLNFEKALDICEHFKDRIKVTFGIGTFITNDLGDYEENGVKYTPLSIVMKLVYLNGHPIAKITDEPSKAFCLVPEYLTYFKLINGVV